LLDLPEGVAALVIEEDQECQYRKRETGYEAGNGSGIEQSSRCQNDEEDEAGGVG